MEVKIEKTKKFADEFKEFITKGNVMDMAVGVIIGGAFQKIISSLVDRVVIVSSENYTPKTDLLNTKKAIENSHGVIAGLVINNISAKNGSRNKYYYYYEEDEK